MGHLRADAAGLRAPVEQPQSGRHRNQPGRGDAGARRHGRTVDARDDWPESPAPLQVPALLSPALVGHRQVTNAYLLGLAAHKREVLATLDRGLRSFARALGLEANVERVSAAT